MAKTHIIDPNEEYRKRTSIAFQGEYKNIIDQKDELKRQVNYARSCFEEYLICEGSLKNVVEGGETKGFSLGIRINWYRSMAITLIRRIEIMVDGEVMPREAITFQVEGQKNRYKLDDIGEEQAEEYWYLNKIGYVGVEKPGGLKPGLHEVEVALEMFVTYHNYPDLSYMKKIMIVE